MMYAKIYRYDVWYVLIYMTIYEHSRYIKEFSTVYDRRKKLWSHNLRAVLYTLINGQKSTLRKVVDVTVNMKI